MLVASIPLAEFPEIRKNERWCKSPLTVRMPQAS
jgi:hypothetical protein